MWIRQKLFSERLSFACGQIFSPLYFEKVLIIALELLWRRRCVCVYPCINRAQTTCVCANTTGMRQHSQQHSTRLRIHNLPRGVCRRSCLHLPNRVNGYPDPNISSLCVVRASARVGAKTGNHLLSLRIPAKQISSFAIYRLLNSNALSLFRRKHYKIHNHSTPLERK